MYLYIYIYILHIYIYTYKLYDKWRVKLAETQYLRASFTWGLLQGRRIYKFITICELRSHLEKLMSYK